MPNPEYNFFASFPSKDHIETVCMKKGTRGCGFLVHGAELPRCGKLPSKGDEIGHEYVGRGFGEKAECDEFLKFIIENGSKLIGNKTTYDFRRGNPVYLGALEELSIDEDGIFHMRMQGGSHLYMPKEDVLIDLTPDGFRFMTRGTVRGTSDTTVLFEKAPALSSV